MPKEEQINTKTTPAKKEVNKKDDPPKELNNGISE